MHGDCPRNVAKQKTAGAREVHDAAANLDDEQRHDDTAEQAPARNRDIDLLNVLGIRETNHDEQISEVVAVERTGLAWVSSEPERDAAEEEDKAGLRDQRVARPLSEETKHGGNDETAAQAGGLEKMDPGLLGRAKLELDGGLHLSEFGSNELGAAIAFSVVLQQDLLSLLRAVLGDEPAGALREEAAQARVDQCSFKLAGRA